MYRQGATGALLDIYEGAVSQLKVCIRDIPDQALTSIADAETIDENCKSIQGILSHVVHAGFGYATSIHNLGQEKIQRPDKVFHTTIREYMEDLDQMFLYTENVFKNIEDKDLEQYDNSLKILTSWGQLYDIEQLMEHAIVHILRHERQIGRLVQSTET